MIEDGSMCKLINALTQACNDSYNREVIRLYNDNDMVEDIDNIK